MDLLLIKKRIYLFKMLLVAFWFFQFSIYCINSNWLLDYNTGLLGRCFQDQLGNTASWFSMIEFCMILAFVFFVWVFFPRLKVVGLFVLALLIFFFYRYPLLYTGWIQIAMCYTTCVVLFDVLYDENNIKSVRMLYFVLLFQIGLIYTLNAWAKSGPLWKDGLALRYTLQSEWQQTSFTNYIQSFDAFLWSVSKLTIVWEWMILPALMLAFFIKREKWIKVTLFSIILFHVFVAIFLHVGYFYVVSFSLLAFVLPDRYITAIRTPLYTVFSKMSLAPFKAYIAPIVIVGYLLVVVISCGSQQFDYQNKTAWRYKNTVPFSLKYSAFSQFWHLYSPDPPAENGFFCTKIILQNGDSILVKDGLPISNMVFENNFEKLVYTALLQNYKKKNFSYALQCLLQKEIALSRKNGSPAIKSAAIVLFSKIGWNLKTYKQIELIRINLK